MFLCYDRSVLSDRSTVFHYLWCCNPFSVYKHLCLSQWLCCQRRGTLCSLSFELLSHKLLRTVCLHVNACISWLQTAAVSRCNSDIKDLVWIRLWQRWHIQEVRSTIVWIVCKLGEIWQLYAMNLIETHSSVLIWLFDKHASVGTATWWLCKSESLFDKVYHPKKQVVHSRPGCSCSTCISGHQVLGRMSDIKQIEWLMEIDQESQFHHHHLKRLMYCALNNSVQYLWINSIGWLPMCQFGLVSLSQSKSGFKDI